MISRPTVWLTRPEADSVALAKRLAAHGIRSIVAPVMHIVPAPIAEITEAFDGLLLTSRHAAHALAALPISAHALPVFCVGEATANAARAAGFQHIITGEADVVELLPALVSRLKPDNSLLYFCGEETRVDVASLLRGQRIHVTTQIAYRADAILAPPASLLAALENNTLSAVSFFSPRSATLVCQWLNMLGYAKNAAMIDVYCLSLAVAQSAASLGWHSLHACDSPTLDAMLHLIVSRNTNPVL